MMISFPSLSNLAYQVDGKEPCFLVQMLAWLQCVDYCWYGKRSSSWAAGATTPTTQQYSAKPVQVPILEIHRSQYSHGTVICNSQTESCSFLTYHTPSSEAGGRREA